AARFAAKLDFQLHEGTEASLHRLAYMLDGMPPARIFGELAKMMLAGHALASFDTLQRLRLLSHLMPDVAQAVNASPDSPAVRLLRLGLGGTAERVRAHKSVTPMFMFGVLLWPAILREAGAQDGPMPADPMELVTA